MAYSIYALHASIRSSWTFELFFGTWGAEAGHAPVTPEELYPFLALQGSIDNETFELGSCKLIN
jgi:hypothetical protein